MISLIYIPGCDKALLRVSEYAICSLSFRRLNPFLQQFLQFFYRRQGVAELLRHIVFCCVCSHAHWLIVVLDDILHILLVSALAEDKTNRLILVRLLDFVVKDSQICSKLAKI